MRCSSKNPADHLAELPPVPPSQLEVHVLPSWPVGWLLLPKRRLFSAAILTISCDLSQGDLLLEAELQRADAGESLPALDMSRYNLDPPPAGQRGNPEAWQGVLENAHAQLEHQYGRLLNLELLLKFGPGAWRAHNERLAAVTSALQAAAADARTQVDALNRERKLQQMAAGREIGLLEREHHVLVAKNAEIEEACRAVEATLAGLRDAAGGEQQGDAAAAADD